MIHQIKANIKFNTVYVCSGCGRRSVGDTVRVEFNGHSTGDMKDYVDNLRQTSSHMPDGWSYNGEFNCGCAKSWIDNMG